MAKAFDPAAAAKALGKRGGLKGGKARAESLTPERRSEIARQAVEVRWAKQRSNPKSPQSASIEGLEANSPLKAEIMPDEPSLPEAKYKGSLDFRDLGGLEIPCYVLEGGQRVIGRTSFTEMLTGIRGGGDLEKYLGVRQLRSFVDLEEVRARMVPFRLPEVEGLEKQVKGMPADLAIDVCRGFVEARDARLLNPEIEPQLTLRQLEMATKAGMFLAACAKVGLDALIDEATGYQHDRAKDALQVKLRAYLETEMRKWERTFPDELWVEFGKLTGWSHSVTKRPKYWGKLVMEFIYEYLDPDVAQWLRENAPKPRHGQNYHQWLSEQYGLKKLVEHIWKVIGIASQSRDVDDLRSRMRAMYGRGPLQKLLPGLQDDDRGTQGK